MRVPRKVEVMREKGKNVLYEAHFISNLPVIPLNTSVKYQEIKRPIIIRLIYETRIISTKEIKWYYVLVPSEINLEHLDVTIEHCSERFLYRLIYMKDEELPVPLNICKWTYWFPLKNQLKWNFSKLPQSVCDYANCKSTQVITKNCFTKFPSNVYNAPHIRSEKSL